MANTVKKLAIVSIIMGIFKIGEEGKLINFFSRIITTLQREIVDLKHNIKGLQLELRNELGKLEDKIDDAKVALKLAYTDINVDELISNKTQTSYMEEYLDQLSRAEKLVARLEAKYDDVKKAAEKSIDAEQEQIKIRETRIKTIQDYK